MPSEIEVIRAALRANPEQAERLKRMATEGKFCPMEEIPPDEELTVIGGYDHAGITGSQQARCACAAIVWVSPSTQAMILARGATPTRIICIACCLRELKARQKETDAQARPN